MIDPHIEQIFKLPIVGDIRGRKMIVVVNDRLRSRVIMIKPPRRFALQQKVFVDEHVPPSEYQISITI
jgi:hypothetical protein